MGKYPVYPDYKDSGIAWIGEIPAHWDAKRLRHLARKIGSGKTPRGGSEVYVDEGVLFIRSQNVYDDGMRLDDVVYILPETDYEMAHTRVESGDILLNITGASIGRTCLVPTNMPPANVNQHVCIIRVDPEDIRPFLALAMKSDIVKAQIDAAQTGAAREGLPFEQIAKLAVPFPPLDEQQAIARFLDSKTAQIDALIAKKEALLAKLAEKRTALISQAVTCGLDPTVPMKDSGIPWLGEIPAHWHVKRLKFISPEQSVGVVVNPSSYVDEDGTVPFIYGANIREYSIDGASARRITEESNWLLAKSRLNAGDLLVVRVGAPGVTAVVPPALDQCNCASVMFVRQHASFVSEWLCHAFNAPLGRFQIELVQYGAAQKQFNIEHAVNFVFPVPPKMEQQAIVDFITEQLAPLEGMEKNTQRAIVTLKEYRTALITAAVTGKIDVRTVPEASPPITPEMEAEYA